MSSLSVSYQSKDSDFCVCLCRCQEPTVSVDWQSERPCFAADGTTIDGMAVESASEHGLLTLWCESRSMEAESFTEDGFSACSSTAVFRVRKRDVPAMRVRATSEGDFRIESDRGLSDFTADAFLIFDTPDTPYLNLSRYNIWIVPEYYENVDVYSNTDWNIH